MDQDLERLLEYQRRLNEIRENYEREFGNETFVSIDKNTTVCDTLHSGGQTHFVNLFAIIVIFIFFFLK